MSNIITFPTSITVAQDAAEGLSEAIKAGRVRAAAIITIEVGDKGEQIARIRQGWDENTLTVFEVLAFSAAVGHAKDAILDSIET